MNRYERQGDPNRVYEVQSPTAKPSVGGWLLFFCLSTAIGVFKAISTIVATHAPLYLALYVTLTLIAALAAITVWARASSALTCVSFDLGIRFLYGLFQIYLGIGMSKAAGTGAMSPSDTEFLSAFTNILTSVVWYLYFHFSTRVRETLGHNL